MCTPPGVTNWIEWLIMMWLVAFGRDMIQLFAVHSADHTVVPGATCCWMMGSKVAAFLLVLYACTLFLVVRKYQPSQTPISVILGGILDDSRTDDEHSWSIIEHSWSIIVNNEWNYVMHYYIVIVILLVLLSLASVLIWLFILQGKI